jgi:hypothetical protein
VEQFQHRQADPVLGTAFTPLHHLEPLRSLQVRLFLLPIMPLVVEVVVEIGLLVAVVVDSVALEL